MAYGKMLVFIFLTLAIPSGPACLLFFVVLRAWSNSSSVNRFFFLNIINHWWRHKQAPESIFRARVVSIFKKGDTDLPENYRPISLLTTIYKGVATMLDDSTKKAG